MSHHFVKRLRDSDEDSFNLYGCTLEKRIPGPCLVGEGWKIPMSDTFRKWARIVDLYEPDDDIPVLEFGSNYAYIQHAVDALEGLVALVDKCRTLDACKPAEALQWDSSRMVKLSDAQTVLYVLHEPTRAHLMTIYRLSYEIQKLHRRWTLVQTNKVLSFFDPRPELFQYIRAYEAGTTPSSLFRYNVFLDNTQLCKTKRVDFAIWLHENLGVVKFESLAGWGTILQTLPEIRRMYERIIDPVGMERMITMQDSGAMERVCIDTDRLFEYAIKLMIRKPLEEMMKSMEWLFENATISDRTVERKIEYFILRSAHRVSWDLIVCLFRLRPWLLSKLSSECKDTLICIGNETFDKYCVCLELFPDQVLGTTNRTRMLRWIKEVTCEQLEYMRTLKEFESVPIVKLQRTILQSKDIAKIHWLYDLYPFDADKLTNDLFVVAMGQSNTDHLDWLCSFAHLDIATVRVECLKVCWKRQSIELLEWFASKCSIVGDTSVIDLDCIKTKDNYMFWKRYCQLTKADMDTSAKNLYVHATNTSNVLIWKRLSVDFKLSFWETMATYVVLPRSDSVKVPRIDPRQCRVLEHPECVEWLWLQGLTSDQWGWLIDAMIEQSWGVSFAWIASVVYNPEIRTRLLKRALFNSSMLHQVLKLYIASPEEWCRLVAIFAPSDRETDMVRNYMDLERTLYCL